MRNDIVTKGKKKILLINDYLLYGGAEIYTLNLKKILKSRGYDVSLLCFDNEFESKSEKIEDIKSIYNIKSTKSNRFINKVMFNPILYEKIKEILKRVEPEIIIVNNLFINPVSQWKALEGYKVYQVVHDYGVVCPKSTAIVTKSKTCLGYKSRKCLKCCRHNGSKLQLLFKLRQLKKVEKLRKQIVTKLITPSDCLRKYLEDFEYNVVCINNPIEMKDEVVVDEQKFKTKKFIYVGGINDRKGIFEFIETFIKFTKDKSIQIDVIGQADTVENEERLQKIVEKFPQINYLGQMSNAMAIKKIRQAYCMVVPSLWIENYPTTVLEAQMQKTIVLGSNRGGIPEMLQKGKGYVVDVLDENRTMKVLEEIYTLQEEQYKEMVDNAYNYVKKNNSFEEYAKKIVEIIEE